MGVKGKLRPYIRRMHQAYLFKIGLMSISLVLVVCVLIALLSKFILLVDVWSYQLMASGLVLVISIFLAWLKRPKKALLYKKIDQLGFENRVTTYLEYKNKDNPFTDYLEEDLLKNLETDHYKEIRRLPKAYYFIAPLLLALLLTGLSFWTTDISLKAEAIAEDIEALEEEEVALEEALKDEISDLENLKLAEEEMKESLEEIKNNLRQENRELAEQNLFKMQESLDRQLTGEGLPEAVDGIMEGIKEVALETDGPTLLSTLATSPTLGEGTLSEGQLSEGDLSDNQSSQSGTNNQNSGQSGDGT
jgi:hypothetical protein